MGFQLNIRISYWIRWDFNQFIGLMGWISDFTIIVIIVNGFRL